VKTLILALTEDEATYIDRIGRARFYSNLARGSPVNDPVGETDAELIHKDICGFAAEFKAAQHYVTRFDPRIGRGLDPGYDILIAGLGVGVKARVRPHYDELLIAKYRWPLKPACRALLMARVDWPRTVEICGWVTKDRFVREHRLREFRKEWGKTRSMHMKQLAPYDTLKPLLELIADGWRVTHPPRRPRSDALV
jgi:hypothetical protein